LEIKERKYGMENADNSLAEDRRLRAPPEKEKRPPASRALSTELAKESQNAGSQSSSIVEELRGLLGNEIILLPIRPGSKKPIPKDWQNTTLTQMQDPEYLAQLNHGGNLGVLLGSGLITIDLDCDEVVEPFLTLDPKLRQTLWEVRAI